jgi:hypothetical protein
LLHLVGRIGIEVLHDAALGRGGERKRERKIERKRERQDQRDGQENVRKTSESVLICTAK